MLLTYYWLFVFDKCILSHVVMRWKYMNSVSKFSVLSNIYLGTLYLIKPIYLENAIFLFAL